jgi:L-ascorbate metabolism protein UlaG (beta-lactamase superfamily)
MHIYWYGLSSFKIVTKDATVFTDPFGKSSGLTPPRGAGQIVLSSDPDNEPYNNFSAISGDPFVINGPGEYDVKGVFVRGIPMSTGTKKEDKKSVIDRRAIYSINAEGINIAFLGSFSGNTLTEAQEEALGEADILIIPVGGKGVLDASSATELSNQLDEFLKEFGDKGEDMEKLLIKKSDFEEEKTKVVTLSPQR